MTPPSPPGRSALERAAADLAGRLPPPLAPLASIAYNYRWSWHPRGEALFRGIDAERWELCGANPVRLLLEASPRALDRAAADESVRGAAAEVLAAMEGELRRPPLFSGVSRVSPVAFLCAEFAVHRSLPLYAGGLGVLAGDVLKEASDLGLPMVGVGLLYREGYFSQRVDGSGYQHECWSRVDPSRLPAALVTADGSTPLTVTVPVRGRQVCVQAWRVDVGCVPLLLLDADRPENPAADRWITGRLYTSDRSVRLAQYALLGIGSIRLLEAMGIDPAVVHLNEGHAALAPLELARRLLAGGEDRHAAYEAARARTVFTTHTPVSAGNEGYDLGEISEVVGDFPREVGMEGDEFLRLGRIHAANPHDPFVMTPLGIKMSRHANGVSRRHGEVARAMWQPLFAERPVDAVPLGHVTNGVHVPTWMAAPMRDLLDRHLGGGWEERSGDPRTWDAVDAIPDEELWEVRRLLRSSLAGFARRRSVAERLARGEQREYAEAAEHGFSEDALTLGFARRLTLYKRLHLLTADQQRLLRLIEDGTRPLQLIVAGKAHPHDEEAKHSSGGIFALKQPGAAARSVTFIDNYDLGVAAGMVAGCDVWINLPRPPLEASGTSGMKSALNGGINLSVLDGWWAEAYEEGAGWAIGGDEAADLSEQDARHAAAFYDLLEREVVPTFYDRDASGIPRRWLAMVKRSLRIAGSRFSARRMVEDYAARAYGLTRENGSS